MHRRSLTKAIGGTALALSAVGLLAPAAGAATPAVQACVGSTFSAGAHEPGPLGQVVSVFAQVPDGFGLGNAIQALQAGLVPDALVPNTCND
jgi:hypothetical protein